jgi:hypothetical protein
VCCTVVLTGEDVALADAGKVALLHVLSLSVDC